MFSCHAVKNPPRWTVNRYRSQTQQKNSPRTFLTRIRPDPLVPDRRSYASVWISSSSCAGPVRRRLLLTGDGNGDECLPSADATFQVRDASGPPRNTLSFVWTLDASRECPEMVLCCTITATSATDPFDDTIVSEVSLSRGHVRNLYPLGLSCFDPGKPPLGERGSRRHRCGRRRWPLSHSAALTDVEPARFCRGAAAELATINISERATISTAYSSPNFPSASAGWF